MAMECGGSFAGHWAAGTVVEFYHWLEGQREARRLLADLYLVNGVLERVQRGQAVSVRAWECACETAEQLRDIASAYGFVDMMGIFDEVVHVFKYAR